MSPATTYGDATNSAVGAPETGGSDTPYTDYVYSQILQGATYPSPDGDDAEEDNDADTVLDDDDDEDDDDDDSDDDEDSPRVDYLALAAQVSDPRRITSVNAWREDLAVRPANYVGDWLRAHGKSALFGISDAQFEAFVGFPREFVALRTRLDGNGEPYTVRECRRYVRLIEDLWKVKTQPVKLMHRRKEAIRGSRSDVQAEARRRRRELLALGQSYWTDPTPLRVVSLPGEEEFDEDTLMAEFLGLEGDEFDEDTLMAEFLGLDGDESRLVGAPDGRLTVDGGVAGCEDAMIDPMLFDPRVLEGTAADEMVELLVAEEEDSALVVGAGLSPDVMTEEVGAASGNVDSAEVEAAGDDSAVVGVGGEGEGVVLDEALLAEVVAVDSDEAPRKGLVANDSDEAQALRSEVVASDSNEAPRKGLVANDADEAPRAEVVAGDSGASTLPSSFTWGMAGLSDVADMAAVTDASAEVDAVEAVDDEVVLNLEGDGAVEVGEVAELKGGSELDLMTVDSDLGRDVVREAADLGLDAGVVREAELGDGTDLDLMTFDSGLGREVTEDADHVDAGAAEIVIKLEDSPEVDLMPLDSDRGMDASDGTAHLDAGVSDGAEADDDSDLDSMPVDSDLEEEPVYDAPYVDAGVLQSIEFDEVAASDDEMDGEESTDSEEAPRYRVVARDSDDDSSVSDRMSETVQPEPARGQQTVDGPRLGSFAYARIALADPVSLDHDDQIFRLQMETAYMKQQEDDIRSGRDHRLRGFYEDEDPVNNWGFYWQREDLRHSIAL